MTVKNWCQCVRECNSKHEKELALVKQMELNGRMEMIACVVDPFQRRAHKILPHTSGDIDDVETFAAFLCVCLCFIIIYVFLNFFTQFPSGMTFANPML